MAVDYTPATDIVKREIVERITFPSQAGLCALPYAHTMAYAMTVDDLRTRLREALHARRISQNELAKRLTAATGDAWMIAHLSKILNGHIRLRSIN